jgi:hypothetical protein
MNMEEAPNKAQQACETSFGIEAPAGEKIAPAKRRAMKRTTNPSDGCAQ